MPRTRLLLLLSSSLVLLAPSVEALQVRFQSDRAHVYEEEARRGLFTVLVHGVAVLAGDSPVEVEELRLEVLHAGRVTQVRIVGPEELRESAARMAALQENGLLQVYEFALQLADYVGDSKLSADANLTAGTALVLRGIPLIVRGVPDELRATVKGTGAEEQPVTATARIPVVDHRSAISYRFPLEGAWLVAIGPDFGGHHRWIEATEFALDIVRQGDGGLSHRDDGTRLEDYFGYGEPVLAVADGEVVAVEANVAEDTKRLRHPVETWEAFEERTVAEQGELLAKSPIAAAGNYLTIRHAEGEYSHYAHLAGGSVRAQRGDRVRRGEVIGRLGHTGNSTEPHLHFQMMDGPDALEAGSLPVRFDDLEIYEIGTAPRHLQTGWIVVALARQPATAAESSGGRLSE